MLEGYVDQVTPQGVSGWAADDEVPDRIIEVLIFVNGTKVARVTCDRLREDLRRTERFGEGRHGFRYSLEDAIPDDAAVDVGVHFADTGLAVGNATFRLNGDETQRCFTAPMHASVPTAIPGPRAPRETLGVLSLYEPEVGLLALLDRLDLKGRSPASVWYSAFGSAMPADQFEAEWADPKAARDALYDWLGSEEFQQNLFPIALQAFPEKQRVIFVHIPKCGGTHVGAYLARRLPRLDHALTKPAWTRTFDLFERLAWFSRLMSLYDSILVTGHVQLPVYAKQKLIRPADSVFTVVRDPVDMVISQVNYVLTRIAADSAAGLFGQDTKEWLQMLELDTPDLPLSDGFIETVATRALHHPLVVPKNPLCFWLGDWDMNAAISLLRIHDVEITDVRRLDDWLQARWGIMPSPRHNESVPYFTPDTLPMKLMDHIRENITGDLRLYARIAEALEQSGEVSVRGREI